MMAFSNRARKAELLCLRVFDENKQRIEPEMREVIALKDYRIEEHVIVAGGEWVYRLTGEVREGYLEYKGAAYRIAQRQTIACHFDLRGVRSNSLMIDMRTMLST